MSEKKHTFEADMLLVKNAKRDAELKQEKMSAKDVSIRISKKQRTYSRDTVTRLIEWFKQD